MDLRTTLLGLGSGITSLLLGGGLAMKFVDLVYGEGTVAGRFGVAVGAFAGVVTAVTIVISADSLWWLPEAAVAAYAAFGVTFLVASAVDYAELPVGDGILVPPLRTAISLVASIVAAGLVRRRGRRGRTRGGLIGGVIASPGFLSQNRLENPQRRE